MPDLQVRDDSDSESEDEDSVDESYFQLKKSQNNKTKRASPKMTISRASVMFSLEDEEGNKKKYLGLLNTSSSGSLMSEELVNKFVLETTKSSSTWETNNGAFKTGRISITKNLRFPQFTNKRKVDGSKFYVNQNEKQKYKIIFWIRFCYRKQIRFSIKHRNNRMT